METITEEYTSKCSALDDEIIGFHENYCGKRVHRGLFSTKNGVKINADVNASLNILRKVVPELVISGNSGFADNPVLVTTTRN